jgi:CRP-like cAMP-binding protein
MKHTSDRKDISPLALDAISTAFKHIAPMQDSDMELLPSILQTQTIKKYDYLLKEGEVCRNVSFLVSGLFRMYYIDFKGNEINYSFDDKNHFLVDFQSFITQQPSHFYWQAMQDSELLVLSYPQIQQAYALSLAWNNFGRLIAEHVYIQMHERVEMLLFMSPEERYLHLLHTQPQLFSQFSLFHLSSYLGIKPESLSRLRRRLMQK